VKSQDLRPGNAITQDGQVWVVVHVDHVKPGKGPAYVQAKLRGIQTGSTVERRFRSSEDIEQAVLDRREMEYLYSDASGAIFMDSQSFDQSTLPVDILGDSLKFLKPNTTVSVLVYEGNVVDLELPASVELQVTQTPPAIKGATATNQLKEATCETGLKTRVPPFIKPGEVIRVATETGEYLGRVSD